MRRFFTSKWKGVILSIVAQRGHLFSPAVLDKKWDTFKGKDQFCSKTNAIDKSINAALTQRSPDESRSRISYFCSRKLL